MDFVALFTCAVPGVDTHILMTLYKQTYALRIKALLLVINVASRSPFYRATSNHVRFSGLASSG